MILITGATGTVGRALLDRLLEAGTPVRALTRDPQQARVPAGVEVVGGDLGDEDSLKPALEGVTKVFAVSAGHLRGLHDGNLARAAARAGARHIVQLSSLAVAEDPENILGRWHADGERAIREAGIGWTILRPNGFMSNALQWAPSIRRNSEVRAPFGDLASAPVDPADIAAAAAAVLRGDGHESAIYPLTGPGAVTPRDQVRVLGEVLGRPLRFRELTEAEALAEMSAAMPVETASAVLRARAAAGEFRAQTHPGVEQLTGRRATSFAEWAARNADAFR
jgi:uncharacterized protein YbjT (DUF2867 family)